MHMNIRTWPYAVMHVNSPSMHTERVTCEHWHILTLAKRGKKNTHTHTKKEEDLRAARLKEFCFCMTAAGHRRAFWGKDQQLLTDPDATTTTFRKDTSYILRHINNLQGRVGLIWREVVVGSRSNCRPTVLHDTSTT